MSATDVRLQNYNIVALAVIAIAIGAIVAISLVAAYGLPAMLFIAIVGLVFFKRPLWALFAFILVLPIHSLILTILIAQVGLPMQFVRLVAAWKETLLIGTFFTVILHLLVQKRPVRFTWIDWLAMLWLGQVLLYFLFHRAFFDWQSNLTIKLYGARDWLLYLIPYFIGRLVFVSERSAERILKVILLVGIVTSSIGIVEYFFVPIGWHVQLGVPRYFSEFLNLRYPDYLFNLPENYWTRIGGGPLVRRAVSTHLSGQGFALPFLIIMPVAIYNYSAKFTKFSLSILILCSVALFLTITRMTIVVCFIQALVLLWLLRKKKSVLLTLVIALTALSIVMFVNSTFRTYVVETVTFQDDSSSKRPGQWMTGVQMLQDYPLGLGLGSTGQTSARFGVGGLGLGSEVGYLKITGTLGLPGLLLVLSWFLAILTYSFFAYHKFQGALQGVAIVTLVAAIGFLVNNLTAPPDQSPFTIYVFGWLAGLAIQLATRSLKKPKRSVSGGLGCAKQRPQEVAT